MLLARALRQRRSILNFSNSSSVSKLPATHFSSRRTTTTHANLDDGTDGGEGEEEQEGERPYSDVPRPGRKWERKPYPTPVKVLIRRAKEEKRLRQENPCRVLDQPPDNGLLVPDLVGVAKTVYVARESLLRDLSLLLDRHSDSLPVHRCRFCREVHIGRHGHEIRTCEGSKGASRNASHMWRRGGIRDIVYFPKCYHLYDRVGNPRVGHKERFEVPRLPALVELCIQAGLDLEQYPAKRRSKPVYSIEGRIVDFEPEEDDQEQDFHPFDTATIEFDGEGKTMSELGAETLQSWLEMRSGAAKMMEKYGVVTCGYCTEVQVGPKGHKVRRCKATGHQYRDGLHAWQEATVDDVIGPHNVWHVRDPDGPPLANELKRYYGKAPAVVELCVQAGAPPPREYWSMMRLDVVAPARDEYDLVA